jgi:integrase
MSSLSKSKSGLYTIYARRANGKRTPIRLGRMKEQSARAILDHVEALEVAKRTDTQLPARTSAWLEQIGPQLHARLSRAGLTTLQQREPMPVGDYFHAYIDKRTDLKPGTKRVLRDVMATAIELLGAARDMRGVTVGDVEDYQRALLQKYARATAAMHVKKMRQLWSDAMKRRLLAENPFKAVKAGSMANKSREVYVSADTIDQVIDYCADAEWKLLFAFARYGGLRVPSEIRALRWDDIHFDTGRMVVRSPKTEHHEGHESREIPIFPELEPLLLTMFVRDDRDPVYVMKSLRGKALVTQARKLIERAGVKVWGKLWQNLRASRETDLAGKFPIHVVCAWIGNSVSVAMRHYLQVTDEHFASAANSGAGTGDVSRTNLKHAQGQAGDSFSKRAGERSLQASHPLFNVSHFQQLSHRAMQKAMHEAEGALARLDSRLIRTLRNEVNKAKGGRR